MSKISIFAVLLWIIAALFVAVGVDMRGDMADFFVALGMAAFIAYWGYVLQRWKWGRPKKIANLSMCLWIIGLTIFLSMFGVDGDIVDIVLSSGFGTLLAFIGYKWQLRFMERARIEKAHHERALVNEKSGDSEADSVIAEGNKYIKRLEALGAQIRDEKIRKQALHLQDLSKQIFGHIAKQPEQVRKLNTFMEYYLPTTIKFLENFADMEGKKVRGEHMLASMVEISRSMSCIETAFEHQLDNLYSDKALDISGDVAVLQSIMKQEGMTSSSD